ncbi:hypothetical protein EBR44_08750 [bacterium]|nr:hypothetical protein [bacterium]
MKAMSYIRLDARSRVKTLQAECVVPKNDSTGRALLGQLATMALPDSRAGHLSAPGVPDSLFRSTGSANVWTSSYVACVGDGYAHADCDGNVHCIVNAQSAHRAGADGQAASSNLWGNEVLQCDNGCYIYSWASYYCNDGTGTVIDGGESGGGWVPTIDEDPLDLLGGCDPQGLESGPRLWPEQEAILFHPERVYSSDERAIGGPSAEVSTACIAFEECTRSANEAESRKMFDAAKASGEWNYTQGGAKGGSEHAKDRAAKWGDCTDYVFAASQVALDSTGWKSLAKYLTTTQFRTYSAGLIAANGYVAVSAAEARQGDVVVRGGHAGLFIGPSTNGRILGLANNGTPATENTANHDGVTGVISFDPLNASQPLFFRQLVPCNP